MKRLVSSIFLSLFFSVQASWFGYDRAIAAARGGDRERAARLLTEELIARPEDPAVLYDNGVLAAQQKDFMHAETFFSKTVKQSPPEGQLHRQALFNLGNACVESSKLHEALHAYEQLLALDPQHEKARHNRDVVKKMLEQQQSQDGSQQDNKKQNQENKQQNASRQSDSKEQGDNTNKSEQQQGNQDQKSGQQKSGTQEKPGNQNQQNNQSGSEPQQGQQNGSGEQQKRQSHDQSAQNSQKNGAHNEQSSVSDSPDGTSPDGRSRNQEHQKRDDKDSNQLDERDSYKERYGKRDNHTDGENKQQSGAGKTEHMKNNADKKEGSDDQRTQQHDDSPSRTHNAPKDDTTSKIKKVGGKAQESAKKETKKQYAEWAESMLDAVQLNDEALNKVLVQKAVAGNLGGRDGECCW